MKNIFIFFTQGGGGELVSDFYKKKGYETLRLETVKKIGRASFFMMMHYGRRASFKKKEALKPYSFNKDDYDEIVIYTPVWADRLATPINTFLADNNLKDKKVKVLFSSLSGHCKKGRKDLLSSLPSSQCFDLLSPTKYPDKLESELNKIQ